MEFYCPWIRFAGRCDPNDIQTLTRRNGTYPGGLFEQGRVITPLRPSPPKVSFSLIFPNMVADKDLDGCRYRAVSWCAGFVDSFLHYFLVPSPAGSH